MMRPMAKNVLSDRDVVRIIKEEYEQGIVCLAEGIDMFFEPSKGQGEKNILAVDLKVRDKRGVLYTVDSVGSWGVILKRVLDDGSEKQVKVDRETFERDFSLKNQKKDEKDES